MWTSGRSHSHETSKCKTLTASLCCQQAHSANRWTAWWPCGWVMYRQRIGVSWESEITRGSARSAVVRAVDIIQKSIHFSRPRNSIRLRSFTFDGRHNLDFDLENVFEQCMWSPQPEEHVDRTYREEVGIRDQPHPPYSNQPTTYAYEGERRR